METEPKKYQLTKEKRQYYNRYNSKRYHIRQLKDIKMKEQHKLELFNEQLKSEGLENLVKANKVYYSENINYYDKTKRYF
jgi:hypothetical protein